MPWDEWEQLKAAAVGRHSTQMQLNESPADQSGSGGGASAVNGVLKHTNKPWTRAAGTANDLKSSTTHARTDLDSGHASVAAGAEGLASLSVLKTVLASWDERLAAVRDECNALEPKLRQVAQDLGEVDVRVGAKADAVHVPNSGSEK